MKEIEHIKELTKELNKYRDYYYNRNTSLVTDEQYDKLFDELKELEDRNNFRLTNSPTKTVGYKAQSNLNKVEHNHPMLSLDKTKDTKDLLVFSDNKFCLMMLKMDGLTCSLRYKNGKLVSAETRGNGQIGEDITENIKQVGNVPLIIDKKEEYIIDGEIIIDYDSFNKVNEKLETKYSHPRNLASGSIRQLDTRITKERNLSFIAWKVVKGYDTEITSFSTALFEAVDLGFEVVPFKTYSNPSERLIIDLIESLKKDAEHLKYPIDGMVIGFDDIHYAESLGKTNHHVKYQLAYKFYNEGYETTLEDIIWQPSRTGQLNPVAVFQEIDLDGALTTRASLSNISILKETLGEHPYVGQKIKVARMNEVIPKIVWAEK